MNSSKKIMNQQNKTTEQSQSATPAMSNTKLGSAGGGGSNIKAIVLGAICVVIVLILCVGVGIQQLKPQTVLTVDGEKMSMDDMMYPIYEKESQYLPMNEMYQYYMGTSVWETAYQGGDSRVKSATTNADGLKQEIIISETEYTLLYNEAVKEGYKLTADEEKDAEKKAEDALKGLSWSQKFKLSISKKKLTKRFEKRALADKYKEDKQKELNKTVDEKKATADISKKDYREYDIQYYYVALNSTDANGNTVLASEDAKKKYKKAINALAKKAATAKKFDKLIKDEDKSDIAYSEGQFTEKDGWTFLSDANLKKVKKMKNGTISEVFFDETSGYYVFVKMINNNSQESYKTAYNGALQTAQTEKYNEWYEKFEKEHKVKVNNEVWDYVTIGTVTTDIVTAEDLQAMNEDASSGTSEK